MLGPPVLPARLAATVLMVQMVPIRRCLGLLVLSARQGLRAWI